MQNLNNTYIQVPKQLFNEIQEMKKRQDEIPHYRAQVKSIEGFKDLSTEEKLQLAKFNMDEVRKQYRNEEDKGWINRSGYAYHDNRNAHVAPIISHLFDVEGLSKFLNDKVEASVEKEYADDEQMVYNMKITKRIRFIDKDIERYIMDTISDSTDVAKCKFLYQSYMSRYTDTNEPVGCMFWFQSDKKVTIIDCNTSSRSQKSFEDVQDAIHYWEDNVGSSSFPLMQWKEYGTM